MRRRTHTRSAMTFCSLVIALGGSGVVHCGSREAPPSREDAGEADSAFEDASADTSTEPPHDGGRVDDSGDAADHEDATADASDAAPSPCRGRGVCLQVPGRSVVIIGGCGFNADEGRELCQAFCQAENPGVAVTDCRSVGEVGQFSCFCP